MNDPGHLNALPGQLKLTAQRDLLDSLDHEAGRHEPLHDRLCASVAALTQLPHHAHRRKFGESHDPLAYITEIG